MKKHFEGVNFMKDISEKLRNLYFQYWGNLEEALKRFNPVENKISYPLLLDNIPAYWESKNKLMVVGQQTNHWFEGYFLDKSDVNIIEKLMAEYKKFNVGENYNNPFFSVTKKLFNQLNPNSSVVGYMWTNLIKMDESTKRPSSEIEDAVFKLFPVVAQEIKILKPDILIFFTGPYYDKRLKDTFIESSFENIDGFKFRELVKIRHDDLPQKTFRTYHPKYLRLINKENTLINYLANIITE